MATQSESKTDLSARKVAERLKEEGKERLDRGKSAAAQQVDQVASAIKSAGNELGGKSTVGSYANHFAGSIGRFGQRLRDSSIEDLAGDMQTAARRNPTMFILGGLALGVVLARLVKASTPEVMTIAEDVMESAEASSSDRNTSDDPEEFADEIDSTGSSSMASVQSDSSARPGA